MDRSAPVEKVAQYIARGPARRGKKSWRKAHLRTELQLAQAPAAQWMLP
jgi:hypothetical protein